MTNELLSLDYLLREDAGQAFGVRRTVHVEWSQYDRPEPPYHNQVRFSTWTKEPDEQYMDIYVHEEDNKLHFRAMPDVFWDVERKIKEGLLSDLQIAELINFDKEFSCMHIPICAQIEQTKINKQTDAKISLVILDICRAAGRLLRRNPCLILR